MLGEEPPNPAEPCHSHLPGSPLKALPIFRASPESRPPTKKWSGSRAGVIYIHSQARGSGHPRGTGNRLGGQGPGCGHHHGTGRGLAQRGLQNPLWPVGKEGLPLVVPEAHTGPRCLGGGGELWTRAMAGGDGGMRWRDAGLQVLEDGHQWWKLRNRSGQAGYVPGNILAETRLEDVPQEQVRGGLPRPTTGRQGRGEVAKDPARTLPAGTDESSWVWAKAGKVGVPSRSWGWGEERGVGGEGWGGMPS